MTKFAVVENKISAVKKYLKILERYQKFSRQELEKNLDIKGAVERYLYLAMQSVIDLAEAIISYKNFRKPTTLSEAFYILQEEKIIPENLTEKMAKMTGFRNFIAHDYEKINFDVVYDVLHNKLKDIKDFLKIIAKLK